MKIPEVIKIYHIVHVDRLKSIIDDDNLWCDAKMVNRQSQGTTIGMDSIKRRRLHDLKLSSYPDLHVGDCVPFYFCPRSVMLYLIYQANHKDLEYRGGQEQIVHLEADFSKVVEWANKTSKRWAFTLSNAGSNYFEDSCRIDQLHLVNWDAILTDNWSGAGIAPAVKEGKQAEFLMEYSFPWHLIDQIGVLSQNINTQVNNLLPLSGHSPSVQLKPEWYY